MGWLCTDNNRISLQKYINFYEREDASFNLSSTHSIDMYGMRSTFFLRMRKNEVETKHIFMPLL